MKPTFEFTIDRSRWSCASNDAKRTNYEYFNQSSLLDTKNFQCCLGFLGSACGIPADHLLNVAIPSHSSVMVDYPASFLESDAEKLAVTINDDRCLSSADRERQLKDLFSQAGIRVKFIGKYL